MSLYPTRLTPILQDESPHMPTVPQLWTHSTDPVGPAPGPECPQSRCKRKSLHFSSVPSMASSNHSQETPQLEELLVDTHNICVTETLFFNQLHHVLQQSPLALIMEQSYTMVKRCKSAYRVQVVQVLHEWSVPLKT